MLLRKWQIFPIGKLWYLNYGNAILCNRVHIPVVRYDHRRVLDDSNGGNLSIDPYVFAWRATPFE